MKAAVLGAGLITPLGDDLDAVLDRLLAGERAAAPNPRFDAATYGCTLAAAIRDEPPKTPHDRVLLRMARFGYQVARRALGAADIEPGARLGLFSGFGGLRAHWNDMLPALADQRESFEGAWERGLRKLHPFWMLQHLSNNAHALVSADVDARGEGATYGGASAGAQALEAATWALEAGAIDAALVVAYDSLIEPETVVEMTARGAGGPPAPRVGGAPHARRATAAAGELAAPYDRRAAGFVPGEAAAALVLCRPGDHVDRPTLRAATVADGRPGAPAPAELAAALAGAGIDGQVAVIDGAALADPPFDAGEREAAAALAAESAPLTAVQSATGQLGAAAPLVQAICLAACLERGELPPIAGLERAAAGPLVPLAAPASTTARAAGCISAGAPGLAAAVRIDVPRGPLGDRSPR